MYQWVLSWADHRAGPVMLGAIAFAESSFFPIPPDLLMIPLAFARPKKAFLFAAICTLSSVAGGALGYALGWGMWSVIKDVFLSVIVSQGTFDRVAHLYEEYAFWSVLTAGFTPIPYKVFTVAAGVFKISFIPFMLASLCGRGGRFFLVGAVIYFFGDRARTFIEKHFEWATIAMLVLGIGGFLAVKFVL